MEKYSEVIYDIQTQTETFRAYTKEEIAEVEAVKAKIAADAKISAEQELQRIAVLDKLGLSAEEAAVLLG
jgi:hypothetical protein